MSEESFLENCLHFRRLGYSFLGLHTRPGFVSYLFQGEGSITSLEQPIDGGAVISIAQVFPLADFAERQLYRDNRIKAIGNINLVPNTKPAG